jgi:hypothetical protein
MLLSCGHGWVPNDEWKLGKNETLHFGLPSSISTRACRPAKLYFNISVANSGLKFPVNYKTVSRLKLLLTFGWVEGIRSLTMALLV